ncbi:MAG: EVE domain-containing protein [Kiritimatiellae bacterium]|nr:EVE domain-containing protein [Kiritimatiellia bacterium]
MFDIEKLKSVLAEYKANFHERWDSEKYKWEAIKHFQDHWDIEAADFGAMFKEATAKTRNLLSSSNCFPKGMIENFAAADGEAVRAMFKVLFNDEAELEGRVETFQQTAKSLRKAYDPGSWKNHYQDAHAISTYLWLRFPDKYYIYKYDLFKQAAAALAADTSPKHRTPLANLAAGFHFYDEICAVLKEDEELRHILGESLTDSCHPDPELRTATIDVVYYLVRIHPEENPSPSGNAPWGPQDYSPNLTVSDWTELLRDSQVFTPDSLLIVNRLKDSGGAATCKQLSQKYGRSSNFYNSGSVHLAKRIVRKTGCPVPVGIKGTSKWWPVLYTGRDVDTRTPGTFMWRLRDELSEALEQIDSPTPPSPRDIPPAGKPGYWWLTANPKLWSLAGMKIGGEQNYTLYNDNGHKRRIFQNFVDAKTGDLVIGYEANPVKKIVAICQITRGSDGKSIWFKKLEGLAAPIEYGVLRDCPELASMQFFMQPNGSLFKLSQDEFDFIMDTIREANPRPKTDTPHLKYTKEDFLAEVYMSESRFDFLATLLRAKQNIILQGPPGVGKTFAARKLAYAMMGEQDDTRIEQVQFHQNYSYEDFVMGYRPDDEGFKLTEGIFHRFCQKAANRPDLDFFFLIDEINRGNMGKIFGELLQLLEKDYRGTQVTLAYNGMPFSVPKNLYLVGMMNSADRSLALIDYALRRRFGFLEMEPAFDSDGFLAYQKSLENDLFNALVRLVRSLNREIAEDPSLGRGFQIGHSYFCGRNNENGCPTEWMRVVVECEILPTLAEYWFDEQEKLRRWENNLRGVFDA